MILFRLPAREVLEVGAVICLVGYVLLAHAAEKWGA